MLICKNDKIVLPEILRKYVVNWYHTYLVQPGKVRTEATSSQNNYWPQLRDNIRTHIKVCNTCKKNMKKTLKYGKLPANEAEIIPGKRLLVDIIGPYKLEYKVVKTPSY